MPLVIAGGKALGLALALTFASISIADDKVSSAPLPDDIVPIEIVENYEEPIKRRKGLVDSLSSGVNAINKVSGNLLSKVGGAASKAININAGKAPRSVAVLPAEGEGTTEEQAEIRIALHNSLGATNIDALKLAEVDRRLLAAEKVHGVRWQTLSQAELATALKVDGLLTVNVDEIERLLPSCRECEFICVHTQFGDLAAL